MNKERVRTSAMVTPHYIPRGCSFSKRVEVPLAGQTPLADTMSADRYAMHPPIAANGAT